MSVTRKQKCCNSTGIKVMAVIIRTAVVVVASVLFCTAATTADSIFRVVLEEPVAGETHGGVGNLRGWAVASEGIEKVEIWIDGAYAFDAPYGGSRGDVRAAFPDVNGSDRSGFSLAYAYSTLTAGAHTISAVARDGAGESREGLANFDVVKFEEDFMSDPNAVNLGEATCSASADEFLLTDALVTGTLYDIVLKWRTAEQGFEIVDIR
jgi:hypothetical protein